MKTLESDLSLELWLETMAKYLVNVLKRGLILVVSPLWPQVNFSKDTNDLDGLRYHIYAFSQSPQSVLESAHNLLIVGTQAYSRLTRVDRPTMLK